MKTKITTLLLACGSVVASPLILNAQDSRPPGPETIKPAQPMPPPPRPEGAGKPDGARKPDGNRDQARERERNHDRRDEGPRGRQDGDRKHERPGGRDGDGGHRENSKADDAKPVTYLGLLTRALSPELAAQSSLPEGFGLLVADVMKDSPAKVAGFEKYDVLVMLGDQRIVNLQQFQALIRAQKKGDEVTLSVRRKGAEVKVSAKLGEHVMPAESAHHGHPMMGHGRMGAGPRPPFGHPGFPGARGPGGDMRERMNHFRAEMRERLEHRREGQGRDDHARPVPPRPQSDHGPMMRGGDRAGHQGPPPSMNRDGDHARGPQHGPGPQGSGPRAGDPRPEAERHHEGGRPGPGMNREDGRAPAPHAEGPHGNGPRPDGPPQGGPRPGANNGPRAEGNGHRDGDRPGPGPRGGEGHSEGARHDAPPPPVGGLPPPRA